LLRLELRVEVGASFYAKAEAKGYVPYSTRRDLDVFRINRGREPD